MLECFKLCPIMLLVCPYYAHTASRSINKNCAPQVAHTDKISCCMIHPLECGAT